MSEILNWGEVLKKRAYLLEEENKRLKEKLALVSFAEFFEPESKSFVVKIEKEEVLDAVSVSEILNNKVRKEIQRLREVLEMVEDNSKIAEVMHGDAWTVEYLAERAREVLNRGKE
jgi:ribosomal protein S25